MKPKTITSIFFSPNGETKKIALYFHQKLNSEMIDLTIDANRENHPPFTGDLCIFSIPVYSQNIPLPIRDLIDDFRYKNIIINITYGGYSYGNILHELKKKLKYTTVIGYSITPVKHAYIPGEIEISYHLYDTLITRIQENQTQEIKIRKRISLLPKFLEYSFTNFNYKITWNQSLCTHCNYCITHCPTKSIKEGIRLPKTCIKCGLCVNQCPTKAITGRTSLPVKVYFLRKQKSSVIIH